MEKSVKRIIRTIIITVIAVLVSIPVWSKASDDNARLLASSFGDLPVSLELESFNPVVYKKEIEDLLLNNISINLKNRNNAFKDATLCLSIDKGSTLDYRALNLIIDEQEYDLEDLYIWENDNYYYFYIQTIELSNYMQKELTAQVLLKDSFSQIDEHAILIFDFCS